MKPILGGPQLPKRSKKEIARLKAEALKEPRQWWGAQRERDRSGKFHGIAGGHRGMVVYPSPHGYVK